MSTLFPIILGQLGGFPKNLEESRESLGENFRHLPSEQIFYRNIPLGAPEKTYTMIAQDGARRQ